MQRSFPWRTSRRAALWLILAALPIIGLLLGLIAPANQTKIELGRPSGSTPRLLGLEYEDNASTLWLLSADNLNGPRTRIGAIAHAPGWDIAAAPAPHAPEAAVLALPPGRRHPQTQAALAVVSSEGVQRLIDGLDLYGGVVWSDDGEHLLVRRKGALVIVDSESGRKTAGWVATPNAAFEPSTPTLVPLAMREHSVWALTIDRSGSTLYELSVAGAQTEIVNRIRISEHITRDWTLSPDGGMLAFTDLAGGQLSVRVAPLHAAEEPPRLLSAAVGTAVQAARLRVAASGAIPDSASPVWRNDGGLNFGSWPSASDPAAVESANGFQLPLSWDASGQWLALRSFSGSGPDDPGDERAAVIGPDGMTQVSSDPSLRIIGWWAE